MRISLGLNGATIPTAGLITGIRAARAAGFVYYEPRYPTLAEAVSMHGCAKIAGERRTAGMGWLPLNALEGVFELNFDELLTRAEEIFRLAAEVGVDRVITVPGRTDRDPDPSVASDTLSALVNRARSHGISLLYELIGFSHHAFSNLSQALSLAKNAGIPLVLDTFHLAVSGADIEQIAAIPSEMIGLVHLSDALMPAGEAALTDADRVLPGEGHLPLGDLLAAISRTSYRGPLSVEVFHPKYASADPGEVAKDAYRRASAVLQGAGLAT